MTAAELRKATQQSQALARANIARQRQAQEQAARVQAEYERVTSPEYQQQQIEQQRQQTAQQQINQLDKEISQFEQQANYYKQLAGQASGDRADDLARDAMRFADYAQNLKQVRTYAETGNYELESLREYAFSKAEGRAAKAISILPGGDIYEDIQEKKKEGYEPVYNIRGDVEYYQPDIKTIKAEEQSIVSEVQSQSPGRFKPLYSNERLVGFEDVIAGKSIGISQFEKGYSFIPTGISPTESARERFIKLTDKAKRYEAAGYSKKEAGALAQYSLMTETTPTEKTAKAYLQSEGFGLIGAAAKRIRTANVNLASWIPVTQKDIKQAGELYKQVELKRKELSPLNKVTNIFFPGISEGEAEIRKRYAYGFLEGARSKPVTTIATTAAFFLAPGILKGIGVVGKATGASKFLSSTFDVPFASKAFGLGLGGFYSASVGKRVLTSATPFFTAGEISSTEIAPMLTGSYLGAKFLSGFNLPKKEFIREKKVSKSMKQFDKEVKFEFNEKKIESYAKKQVESYGGDWEKISKTDKDWLTGQIKARVKAQPERYLPEARKASLKIAKESNLREYTLQRLESKGELPSIEIIKKPKITKAQRDSLMRIEKNAEIERLGKAREIALNRKEILPKELFKKSDINWMKGQIKARKLDVPMTRRLAMERLKAPERIKSAIELNLNKKVSNPLDDIWISGQVRARKLYVPETRRLAIERLKPIERIKSATESALAKRQIKSIDFFKKSDINWMKGQIKAQPTKFISSTRQKTIQIVKSKEAPKIPTYEIKVYSPENVKETTVLVSKPNVDESYGIKSGAVASKSEFISPTRTIQLLETPKQESKSILIPLKMSSQKTIQKTNQQFFVPSKEGSMQIALTKLLQNYKQNQLQIPATQQLSLQKQQFLIQQIAKPQEKQINLLKQRFRQVQETKARIQTQFRPRKSKQESQNKKVLASALTKLSKAYKVEVRREGKFFEIAKGLPLGKALAKGAKATKSSLAQTFRIKEEGLTSELDINFNVPSNLFTSLKKPQPLTFVERRGKTLTTRAEVSSILKAKKAKGRKFKWL